MKEDRKGRAAYAIMLLLAGSIVSKLLGFSREILFAHRFGAGAVSDAFLLTFSLPELLFSSFALAINTNFIPLYLGFQEPFRRQQFLSRLLSFCLLATLLGCIVLNLFPHQVIWLFAASLSDETVRYAVPMLRIVSFSLSPIVLSYVFQAYAQANHSFVSTAITGIVTNSVLLAAIFCAKEDSYYILGLGVVCAHTVLMMLLFFSARKAGLRHTWSLDFRDPDIWNMAMLTLPLIVANLSWNLSVLVDRNIAAYLGTGIITSMSYGHLLSNILGPMVTTAVATAVFPTFAQLVAKGKIEEFSLSLQACIRYLCYTLCPIVVFMILFSDDVTKCVLEHGAMDAKSAKVIWECAACYAVGILPCGLQSVLIKGFFSFQDTKTPAYVNVLYLLCNIGLSLLSAPFFAHIGVTLATSSSYFVGCFLLAYLFGKKYHVMLVRSICEESGKGLLLSVLPAAGVYWLFRMTMVMDSIFIRLVLESMMFFNLYIVLLLVTHRELFGQIVSIVRNRDDEFILK